LNRYGDALPLREEGLQLARQQYPPGHLKIAYAMEGLVFTYSGLARFAEAMALSREGLAILRAAYPSGHPDIAMAEVSVHQIRMAMLMMRHRSRRR